jgi:hypothetical protein
MAKPRKTPKSAPRASDFTLDARPDTIDFRDKMFVPTLVEVPQRITLEQYKAYYPGSKVPILDQGQEGACTGYGLAAVAQFLLRRRKVDPDSTPVSANMFYAMARRYDEWAGEKDDGSSARGAMKGWHKHGVCSLEAWPRSAAERGKTAASVFTHARAIDAAQRPLGAYFRVDHQDLVAMHSALAEVGVLYATASVHGGWDAIGTDGVIPYLEKILGGHAFAIVGYDDRGFWIQNSWGPAWGKQGFALITYDDWLANGTDAWVARLGVPVRTLVKEGKSGFAAMASRTEYSFSDLRAHVVSIGNDGILKPTGQFGTSKEGVAAIFAQDLPRLTAGWKKKRLLLYAHGGLVGEDGALQRAEEFRKTLLDSEVYPLSFVWHTGFLDTFANILKEALRRIRPESFLGEAKDFMLDRLDDSLEPLARPAGRAFWREMKENALFSAREDKGGSRIVLEEAIRWAKGNPGAEIHIVAHSAGAIFMAPLVKLLAERSIPIHSVALWAPACTMDLFHAAYRPAIESGKVRKFSLFTLKDGAERDDECVGIYNKSLLYLVSNAFEEKSGLFWAEGAPLLGMEKFILQDKAFKIPSEKEVKSANPAALPIFGLPSAQWIRSPNGLPAGNADASDARHHGGFNACEATVKATLARILGKNSAPVAMTFSPSRAALKGKGRQVRERLADTA